MHRSQGTLPGYRNAAAHNDHEWQGRECDREPAEARRGARTDRKAKCPVIVAKLDRLSRDVAFISGLMAQRVPFIVTELGLDADPFMLHILPPWPRKRSMISVRTKEALARKKAAGGVLGNRASLVEARKLGAAVQAREADDFAGNVLPIIRQVQAGGATSLRAIAKALNSRNVKTARGATWSAVTVSRIMDRAA